MEDPYWELESKSRFFLSARLDLALDYCTAAAAIAIVRTRLAQGRGRKKVAQDDDNE